MFVLDHICNFVYKYVSSFEAKDIAGSLDRVVLSG